MSSVHISLNERRANAKATIVKLLKDNKNLTVKWTDLLYTYFEDKEPMPFVNLKSIDDFIDGFDCGRHVDSDAMG